MEFRSRTHSPPTSPLESFYERFWEKLYDSIAPDEFRSKFRREFTRATICTQRLLNITYSCSGYIELLPCDLKYTPSSSLDSRFSSLSRGNLYGLPPYPRKVVFQARDDSLMSIRAIRWGSGTKSRRFSRRPVLYCVLGFGICRPMEGVGQMLSYRAFARASAPGIRKIRIYCGPCDFSYFILSAVYVK